MTTDMEQTNKNKKKSISDYTPEELVQKAKDNHVWLNAFDCIRPTDEFKKKIGEIILKRLAETDMTDSIGVSPTIILTVNRS